MSDEVKKSRTLEEVRQEYANACAKAGNIQYQIHTLKNDLEVLNGVLRDLNLEGATAQPAEASQGEAK